MPPDKAPEAISRAVASLPPEQMFELMKQMKLCIQNNPNEARTMLLNNPQLAYALLQAQVIMRIVDPAVAQTLLHRKPDQIAPIMPMSSQQIRPQIKPPAAMSQTIPLMQTIQNTPMSVRPPINAPMLPQQPPQQLVRPEMIDPRFQPYQMQPKAQLPIQPKQSAPPQVAGPPPQQQQQQQAAQSQSQISQAEKEKAALIIQVLQLRDDQIAMLPLDQQQSILTLKEQIAQSAGGILPQI